MSDRAPPPERDEQGEVAIRPRDEVRPPRRYRVVLHNDDFTSMEFVVEVLVRYFQKSETQANRIMLEVHTRGSGVAGVYPRDVAETRVVQVTELARAEGFPLRLTAEPE